MLFIEIAKWKGDKMEKVIVIIGPTAVGKTSISIEIAKQFNGEIINGDSTQVYKELNIGTAKITEDEKEGIIHHLMDIKEPNESFSVAEFQELVRDEITKIHQRGNIPIIVGGTGLYIQSVLYDYEFSEASSNDRLRMELEKFVLENGNEAIHQKLLEVDPVSAQKIHHNNTRRIIRAIEVYEETGIPFSEYILKQKKELLYDATIIGLNMDREKLYERINSRAEVMIEKGLLNEVKELYKYLPKDSQSIHSIGYREFYDYLEGLITKEEAIDAIKQNSRRYAKRQLTWFRNKLDVDWFDVTNGTRKDDIFQYLVDKSYQKIEK